MATNFLQAVATYQESGLAYLTNLGALISEANKKFENFQNVTANLGSTISTELPYRFTAANGLVAVNQGITQRIHQLTVDQSANTSMAITNPEYIFNLGQDRYMEKIGKAAVYTLGSTVEANVALNIISAVPVMIPDPLDNSNYIPSGSYHTESGPCLFFGDGRTPINSYQQFAQMVANYRAMGMVPQGMKAFIPTDYVPAVIGTGLNQFVPRRNDEIAMSWELGKYGSPEVSYFESNLLPTHYAGLVGDGDPLTNKNILTVVSTNDPTGANVTQITCTCDASFSGESKVIKMGDLGQFIDTAGLPNARALTYIGQNLTNQPVQFRITSDADATGTTVVISIMTDNTGSITAPLGICTQQGNAQANMNVAIQAGMKIKIMASHVAGLLLADNSLFLGMPRLPDQSPYDTKSEYDDTTGVALRLTYGAILGKNLQQLVHDCIWAATIVPAYARRILFPLLTV